MAPEPLRASFSGVLAEHGGAGKTFTSGLQFREVFELSYKVLRGEAFEVTGGKVRTARRVDGCDDRPAGDPRRADVQRHGVDRTYGDE